MVMLAKTTKLQQKLNMPIGRFVVTRRLKRVLRDLDAFTVQDVTVLTKKDIMLANQSGEKTYKELRAVMNKQGIEWG